MQAANLADTLSGEGPYTVLDSHRTRPLTNCLKLLSNSCYSLKIRNCCAEVLLNHVVPGFL